MDRITQGLINSFKTEQTLPNNINDSTLFEHFANYCVISSEFSDSFALEDIHVGGAQDKSLDGIAILVNGRQITSKEEVDDLANMNKYLEATFILVQAKSGNHFDSGDIAKFLLGSKDIFEDKPAIINNEQIQEKVDIINSIYDKSKYFRNGKPNCKLYYVTTGKWCNDPNLQNTIDSLLENLKKSNNFEDVAFIPVDADEIQRLYRLANNRITREIKVDQFIALSDIKNVKQAYIAIIPSTEYIKLITDDNKNIIEGLFYDNVRGFQGDNEVNEEIAKTIQTGDHDAFVLYNNGITIVAESLNTLGRKFILRDYQIVNGCQTSYVIYNNQKHLSESLFIPVKLIELDDDSTIKNNIIKSNNDKLPLN